METLSVLQFFVSFLFIIVLIGVFAWVLKKFASPERLLARGRTTSRIKVVDVCYIDAKRKLVLIKRDDREHLLLLSGETQTVIETNIPVHNVQEAA